MQNRSLRFMWLAWRKDSLLLYCSVTSGCWNEIVWDWILLACKVEWFLKLEWVKSMISKDRLDSSKSGLSGTMVKHPFSYRNVPVWRSSRMTNIQAYDLNKQTKQKQGLQKKNLVSQPRLHWFKFSPGFTLKMPSLDLSKQFYKCWKNNQFLV